MCVVWQRTEQELMVGIHTWDKTVSTSVVFKNHIVNSFLINIHKYYLSIGNIALSFSSLLFLKTEDRNKFKIKLNVESDLRLKLSSLNFDTDAHVAGKQFHKSH